jgi:hypothetical protein
VTTCRRARRKALKKPGARVARGPSLRQPRRCRAGFTGALARSPRGSRPRGVVRRPPARLFNLGARSRWTTLTVIWAIQNKIALGTDEEKALELKREIAGGQERCCRMPISRCRRRSSSSLTRRPHASRVRFRRGTPTPPARVDAGFNRSSTRHSQHRPGRRQDGHTITARLGFTEVRGHDAALRPNPSRYNCRFYRFS